jgi:hypothetical protein
MSTKIIFKTALIVVVVTVVAVIGNKIVLPKYRTYKFNHQQQQKLTQIKELTLTSLSSAVYPDEKSAKENRKQICNLTARPPQEREKAIQAIKEFNDNPSDVVYQCSDAFYDTTNDKLISAKSETYTAGLNIFIVNPTTNHIVQADIKEFKNSSKTYSQKEIEVFGKEFIQKHANILGSFDLAKLNHEIGKKEGNITTDTNYFLMWTGESKKVKLDPPAVTCSLDLKKDTPGIYYQNDGTPCIKNYETTITPTLQIAINSRGQILNYTNSFEGEIGRATGL